jgi:hypothetical protein
MLGRQSLKVDDCAGGCGSQLVGEAGK